MGSSLSVHNKYNADTSVADATYDDIDGYHLRDVDDMSSLLSQYIDSIVMDGMNKIINQMITSGHNDLISSSSLSSSSLLSSATAASLQPLVSLSSSSNNNIINNITLKASTLNTLKDHYDYDNIIVDDINTDDDDDDDEANNHINAMLSRSFSSLDYNNSKSSSTLINSYDSDTTCESYTIKSTISWKEAYRIWYCSYVNYPSVHPFIHVSIHPSILISIPSFIIFPSIYLSICSYIDSNKQCIHTLIH